MLLSHGLIGSVYGALLVLAAVAMAVTGTAVVVIATWEGTWPEGCEGMWGRAGRCVGEAGVCAVKGADSATMHCNALLVSWT